MIPMPVVLMIALAFIGIGTIIAVNLLDKLGVGLIIIGVSLLIYLPFDRAIEINSVEYYRINTITNDGIITQVSK